MNKFNYIKPCLVILALNITWSPLFANLKLKAEIKPTNSFLSWVNVFLPLSKPKPPVKPRKAVGRPLRDSSAPSSVCMISPDALQGKPNIPRIVWSDRPLFLWQGNIQQVGLMKNRQTTLWVQKLVSGKQFISYTGEPLQPGETYYWVVFEGDTVIGNTKFMVMEPQERQRITNKLKGLEQEQKAQGANGEAIALTKANYFIQEELWADALQQAYSVEKPSTELLKIRQNILQQMKTECNKSQ
ncbi:DUF928 domain-containing protein [Scytonema sp. UIC 10036]|uniref:DUF928 domain-containing protein n=1 Tax=Scytonema sp. UIC 10036 TaxID=2304196 RepID=UPI0012DA1239|nr:DUF928 domain-containing protein [Scytonema sp. UIC 10036]MUG93448.1 DUF928 domain-containing protein [Scytonema sp. UIC 10036]